MLKWKKNMAPNYALFIKGARRVGKSEIAEEFAKNEYKSYIKIDFDNANKAIKDLFINNLNDLNYIFRILSAEYKTQLYENESVVILDEIQLFPAARQALKTLLKDGRYHYIETGSLAGITKKSRDEEILIPSEEHSIEMFPMDFEEFLWATDNKLISQIIKDHFEDKISLGTNLHNEYQKLFREYMIIGGMPQSIKTFIVNNSYESAHKIKEEILNLYRNDIKEQSAENSLFIENIIDSIPAQLSRQATDDFGLWKYRQTDKNARLTNYGGPINWLNDAMIINIARSVNDFATSLNLNVSQKYMKIYLMDTGLFINLAFKGSNFYDNKFYNAVLFDNLHINEGMFVENIVAQQLRSNGHKTLFHIKYDKNGHVEREIDFIIRNGIKTIPIEVRSGRKKKYKSLEKIIKTYGKYIGTPLIFHDGDLKLEKDRVYLPFYMSHLI